MNAINEIGRAVNEINQSSIKNQTIASQTNSSVQLLAEQASTLRLSIVELGSLVDGQNKKTA